MPEQPPAIDAVAARLAVSALGLGVRTPLHSMLGFAELLAMSDLDADQRHLVEQMVAGADALLLSCARLTSLIRLLAEEDAPPSARFDLSDLLSEVAAAVGWAVTVRVHEEIPTALSGNAEALRQALTELVTNAVQHGGRQATVAVDLTGPATGTEVGLRFSVADAGPGLPDDQLASLAAESAVLPADARRMGLYLARRLAERLGGRLVAARRAGGGTELSLHARFRTAPAAPPAAAPARDAGGLRVLLVEDNSVNRVLAQRQLTKLGHRLDSVTGGEAAVAAVLDGGYDIVLMDRHLPDIDGVEAARRIRAAEADGRLSRRTPIVAVTADATALNREQCLAAGMDGFLDKPLDIGLLRSTLAAFTPTRGAAESHEIDVDLGALGRLVAELDDDRAGVAELLRAYMSELPARRLAVQLALTNGALQPALAAAESLRASSVTVGAVSVARACARILDAVGAGDFTTARQALPELFDACDNTATVLATANSAGML